MKFALVNPPWTFDGSIYFGCREPHLPLEYGYARALLERDGHQVRLFDGLLHGLTNEQIADGVAAFDPDRIVITTAPSYLFWRCAPPELRVPQQTLHAIRKRASDLRPPTSDLRPPTSDLRPPTSDLRPSTAPWSSSDRTRRRHPERRCESLARTWPFSANAKRSCRD